MIFYILSIFMGSLFGAVPLFLAMALYQFAMLQKNKTENVKTPLSHLVVAYLFGLSLLSILAATGLPTLYTIQVEPILSLVPFTDLPGNYVQYIQNMLLFVSFGFLLPLLWKKFEKLQWTLLFGALFSLGIEVAQIFSIRVTDINDLLMNTAGAVVGYFLFVLVKKMAPGIAVCSIDNANHWRSEPYVYFALAWLVMFFIQPVIASWVLGIDL